jgi:hypothetical protein
VNPGGDLVKGTHLVALSLIIGRPGDARDPNRAVATGDSQPSREDSAAF